MATPTAPGCSGILLTSEGCRKLELRLDRLRRAREKEYSERLRDARAHGEAGANDEYLAILEDEAVIDSQIARLEELLRRARVVDGDAAPHGVAVIGSRVTVEDTRTRVVEHLRIVGSLDAGGPGTVTAGSPVGEALLGHEGGTIAEVELPDGRIRKLCILAVEAADPHAVP
jgi:transcription elongation factor GreA